MTRPHLFPMSAALLTLGLGLVFAVTGHGQGTVAGPDLAKLLAQEKKQIDTEMAKTSFSKKGQKRVRIAAFMIALYAQNAKDGSPAMATLRDQALKVMKAAEAGKADEVKKLAATLTPDIKADAAAKTGPVALDKELDLETFMRVYSGDKVGGLGLEQHMEDLVAAKDLDAAQLEKAALFGQKVSLIAKITEAYAPESDDGKKTKKAWNKLSVDMGIQANALAAAALAKKDGDIATIAKKLSVTCTKCHDIFR